MSQYRISIVAVGKLKQAHRYLQTGIAHYEKLLSRRLAITWVELPEECPTATVPVAQVKAREAASILRFINKHQMEDCRVVALSEQGKTFDSEGFAAWLQANLPGGANPPNGGSGKRATTDMLCIVGGAYGLAPEILEQADLVWSLSELTFPHQLVRLIILEQLYRALSIIHHEPYHK
ncbi:MAG: 23S rRNA (pseudouridine(1915)-N(3))-methyltransferase RlmH [Cyanobacteria bacterium HKST-UBA03]|nr:23S rRNA (pseudouridine(1915)-N(3))-methyltransferase RlmH [Cyanobacteria bacterium HKST-UBA05]MCA9842013.1 23S rRNA (pseudouridine(1915)-N(3))-methyltransferase RlmH [Cyanobacteria bacterium HKST-UBA03]